MADIEQQLRAAMRAAVDGEEPAPGPLIAAVRRRYRRRSVLFACVAVVLALAVAIPAVIVARRATAGPTAATHPSTGLRGVPMPAGTNVQLLVSAAQNQAAWYSTATGTRAPITGLSSLKTAGFLQFGRVQGGTWIANGCVRACFDFREYYFIADGSRTATAIGEGIGVDGVVASGHPGAVWLVRYPPGAHDVVAKPVIARLVSTAGRLIGPEYQLPVDYWLQAAVGRYMLLWNLNAQSTSEPDAGVLWDPTARRVVRNIDNPIAASQDQIAWTKGCRGCHVQILNVTTGKSVSTPLTSGPHPTWGAGSFSDNGQLLAYVAPGPSLGGRAVDVVNVATGALLLTIPAVSTTEWQLAGWLNGGPTLMVAVGPAGGHHAAHRPAVQIGIWQPGYTALRVATVKTTAEVYALVDWAGNRDNLYGLVGP